MNGRFRREVNEVANSRGTLFEKELRIERDLFGRFRLTAADTPETSMIKLFLFMILFLLGFLYCVIIIPAKILISRPDRVSFWTYFFWLACFSLMTLGLFFDDRANELAFSLSTFTKNIASLEIWGILIVSSILLINILAIVARVRKMIATNR